MKKRKSYRIQKLTQTLSLHGENVDLMILYLHVYYVTGSLKSDDFPEDDDISTLEVVYVHELPDTALFRK